MSAENRLERDHFTTRDFWIIGISLLLIVFAPSFQSFWIDEGTMGLLCRAPSFSDLQQKLVLMRGSEALMPLATTYFWLLEKVVGEGEWALRCGNLPWLWLGIICLALAGKRIAWPWLPLLFAIHPVIWFYADEVRPYAIQLGTGSWMALGFVQLLQSEGRQTSGLWNFGLAAAATIATSFLGIFVVAAAGFVLLFEAFSRNWVLTLRQYAVLGFLFALNLIIIVFIFFRMQAGAGGSKVWAVGLSNMGFAFYELLGFVGLGAGRELIRTSAVAGGVNAATHLLILSLPWLLVLFSTYVGIVYAVFRAAGNPSAQPSLRLALSFGMVSLLSVLCLFGTSLASEFPFWGRHLAPSLPFLLLTIGSAAASLHSVWTKRQQLFLFAPFFAILIYSSAVIRWSSTHAKDDYRTASALAREAVAQGKRVSWVGDARPALYYHVPLSMVWPPVPGTASLLLPSPDHDGQPDLAIVTKPDLFDRPNILPHWIDLPGVKMTVLCPSFVVYEFP